MFLVVGFLFMRAVVPGGRGFCRHDGWRAVIGAGLGAGIGSLAYLARLITGVPAIAIELLAALVLGWFAWRGRTCDLCSTPPEAWSVLDRYLAGVLAVAIAAAMVLFVRQTALNPHGQWDAWAIHNLHARFLYYPDAWRDLFTPLLTWNHPDYPMLLSGVIASGWRLAGSQTPAVPIAIAFLFTFGTAAVAIVSVGILRNRRQALLAGCAFLTAPSFIATGSWQFADVPVAWFVLAAMVLMAMDYPVAGGLAAGFAAWTKNDGVMLFVMTVTALTVSRYWTLRRLRGFVSGALVPIAVMLWFKLTLAPANPLVSTANWNDHLFDPSRHATILWGFIRHLWSFGGLAVSPFLLLAGYAAIMRFDHTHRAASRVVATTLALAICGDWGVYTFTTADPMVGLIDSSLQRLLVQLWPTAVFLVFLSARSIEAVPHPPLATVPPV